MDDPSFSNVEIDFIPVNGIALVPAKVNDEQGHLIFDTGAMKTALNEKYFSGIQGKELEIAKFSGEMGSDTAREITIRSLSFSDFVLTDYSAMLMDLSYVENSLAAFDPTVRILGTLGIDIIRHFSVMMDYGESRITLDPVNGFDKFTCVPLRMEALPVVGIEIGGEQYPFVLDTGANTCLLGTALRDRVPVQPMDDAPNLFRISSVSLQNRRYSSIAAMFTDISAIQSEVSVEGVIGYQVLSPQRSFFDFSGQKLYLEEA